MGTSTLVYPVILSKDGDGYFVTVPDFDINTEGKDVVDAIAMARDAIGINVLQLEDEGEAVPEPYSRSYQMQDEDVLTYALFPQVAVDFFKLREAKKTKVDATLVNKEDKAYPV